MDDAWDWDDLEDDGAVVANQVEQAPLKKPAPKKKVKTKAAIQKPARSTKDSRITVRFDPADMEVIEQRLDFRPAATVFRDIILTHFELK